MCEVWSADGMMESGCGGGCFSLSASRVASFRGASVSSELANLIAPLKSFSSSFADTCTANLGRVNGDASSRGWDLR